MPFSGLTLALAWLRSGGRCECRETGHGHADSRCGKPLDWYARANPAALSAWAAVPKDGKGDADRSGSENKGAGAGGGRPKRRTFKQRVETASVTLKGGAVRYLTVLVEIT